MAGKLALWLFFVMLGVSFIMEAPIPLAIAP